MNECVKDKFLNGKGSEKSDCFFLFLCQPEKLIMTYPEIRAKLAGKKVGIAGAGGLGSNCAAALVRSGIGSLVIADCDIVSDSNLNRQFYFRDQIGMKKTEALALNLRRINPGVALSMADVRLDPSNIGPLFSGCDVIVEAFDAADQKQMLIETVLTDLPGIPLVIGLGMAGWGRSEEIRSTPYGMIHVCGDGVSEISDESPPLAPRVGIVASMQANKTLELLLCDV